MSHIRVSYIIALFFFFRLRSIFLYIWPDVDGYIYIQNRVYTRPCIHSVYNRSLGGVRFLNFFYCEIYNAIGTFGRGRPAIVIYKPLPTQRPLHTRSGGEGEILSSTLSHQHVRSEKGGRHSYGHCAPTNLIHARAVL